MIKKINYIIIIISISFFFFSFIEKNSKIKRIYWSDKKNIELNEREIKQRLIPLKKIKEYSGVPNIIGIWRDEFDTKYLIKSSKIYRGYPIEWSLYKKENKNQINWVNIGTFLITKNKNLTKLFMKNSDKSNTQYGQLRLNNSNNIAEILILDQDKILVVTNKLVKIYPS
jgi:hypothetical protein